MNINDLMKLSKKVKTNIGTAQIVDDSDEEDLNPDALPK
jgi:hypothetical protein